MEILNRACRRVAQAIESQRLAAEKRRQEEWLRNFRIEIPNPNFVIECTKFTGDIPEDLLPITSRNLRRPTEAGYLLVSEVFWLIDGQLVVKRTATRPVLARRLGSNYYPIESTDLVTGIYYDPYINL